jgi:hypothetical protein
MISWNLIRYYRTDCRTIEEGKSDVRGWSGRGGDGSRQVGDGSGRVGDGSRNVGAVRVRNVQAAGDRTSGRMHGEDVASFVAEAKEVLAATPDMGKRDTELRVVEPFLSTLGWDVRSSSVTAAYSAPNGTVVDYALRPNGAMGAFVATAPAADALSRARCDELLAAMRVAGVPRGAYTNGRDFVLVALTAGGVERVDLSLVELPERTDAVAALSYDAVDSVTEGGGDAVADALVAAEDDAVEAVLDAVLEVARDHGSGDVDGVATDVRPLARRFLDAVVDDLAADDADGDVAASPGTAAGSPSSDDADTLDSKDSAPRSQSADDAPSESNTGAAPRESSDHDALGESNANEQLDADESERASAVADDAAGDGREGGQDGAGSVRSLSAASGSDGASSDGEFVLRFFEDGRSVGAVGSGNVPAAVAQGVQYLLDERGIGPRIRFPYAPGDDDDRAFLHREPVHPDGTRMRAAIDLDGLYVYTGGDVDALQAALEALADRGGLRVMFSGDWS